MSSNNSNTKPIKKPLEIIQLSGSVKINLPDSVIDKIKYLCRTIRKDEWSGVLVYKPVGHIMDSKGFYVDVIDFLLMHKGNATFTEYTFDEDVPMFLLENDYLDYKIGHIHSHNHMPVFFSGTDTEELQDNIHNHNLYLSLIVNNYLEFACKIAWKGTTAIDTVQYKSLDSEGKEFFIKGPAIEKEVMFVVNCDAVSSVEELNVPQSFRDRMEDIIKKAEAKPAPQVVNLPATTPKTGTGTANTPAKSASTPKYGYASEGIGNPSAIGQGWEEKDIATTLSKIDDNLEEFVCYIFRFGIPVGGDRVVQAIEDIEAVITGEAPGVPQRSQAEMAEKIVEEYDKLYKEFWEGDADIEAYASTLFDVIKELEDYELGYPYLSAVILRLRMLLNKISVEMEETKGK